MDGGSSTPLDLYDNIAKLYLPVFNPAAEFPALLEITEATDCTIEFELSLY